MSDAQSQSSSSTVWAGSLATAIVSPAFLMLPQAALAQESSVPQLAPVQVQGEAESFDVKDSASSKFTAPLLDTAKTVQVIPQQVIESQAAASLTDVLRNSPGITFGAGEGGNPLGDRPFIRGYDAQSSTFIDGMRDIGSTSREVFNLQQVEVIKGADGTFGGRGGAGGTINLISKTAQASDFTNASLAIGTDDYYRGTIDSNWKLGETSAFRLNLMYHDQNVAGRDAVDYNRWGVAPTFSFGLGTPTRVTLSYYHLQSDDTPDSGIPYKYPSSKIKPDGSYLGVTRTGPVNVDRDNFYGLTSDYRKTQTDMATVGIEHDITDRLMLRNTTRYTYSKQRYVVTQPDDSQGNVLKGLVWRRANTRVSDVETIANNTELTGKFDTGSLKHSVSMGLELSSEEGKKDALAVNRGTGAVCAKGAGAPSGYNCTSLWSPNPHDPWVNTLDGGVVGDPTRSKTVTKALYAFDTVEFNKNWLGNVGLRVDDYDTKFTQNKAAKNAVVRRDDTLFNYQLGLIYKPVENGSFYVSYGTSSTPANASMGEGSESQSLTSGRGGVGLNAADLAPEKNKTYEIGTKWDVLDRRLTLTGALFRIETTNARITEPDGDYAMAGKKNVQGLELGFSGAITPKWQVYGGYTYIKSKIKDDGVATDKGSAFPNTPENAFSLWTTYALLPQLTVGGGAYYVDKQYGNAANTTYIPSYWRFDAMAGYEFSKNLNVQLNIYNLFDKQYYDKAYAAHYANIAPGRSAILTFNVKY